MLRWVEVAAAIPLDLLLKHGDFRGLCQAVQLYMKRVMAIQVGVMKLFPQLNGGSSASDPFLIRNCWHASSFF